MSSEEAEQLRADLRDRWERSAEFWETGNARFQRASQPVSDWIIERLDPERGGRLLELAAGIGELSVAIAGRLGPGGTIVCSDGAEAMVQAARRRAEQAGVGQPLIEHREIELEWIDAPAASFDGIACRFGVMLCVDPEAALREARRVLKPGGRIALAVWARADQNLWLSGSALAAIAAGHMERPAPGSPGPFALGSPDRLRELLAAAGFQSIEIEPVAITIEEESLDAVWERSLESSDPLRDLVAGLTPAEHYRLRDAVDEIWAPFAGDDGRVAIPGLALCATAEA